MALSRGSLFVTALLSGTALLSLGCGDTGGLLEVDQTPPVAVQGHSSAELTNGGNLAKNGKYKLFYVLGQPTPHQGVATSPDHRSNGGLTGAVNGP